MKRAAEYEEQRIHIWADAPDTTSWHGEGIYQALARLVSSFRHTTAVLYVQPSDAEVVRALFAENRQIELATLSVPWFTRVIPGGCRPGMRGFRRIVEGAREATSRAMERLIRKGCRFLLKRKLRKAARKGACVYFPSPSMAFNLKTDRCTWVVSFWDNFVAEFPQFEDSLRARLSLRLKGVCEKANLIITQSQANKRYLEAVYGINPDAIEVIELGGNDYSHAIEGGVGADANAQCQDTVGFVQAWRGLMPPYKHETKERAAKRLLEASVLYRFCEGFRPDDSLIMVSTQDRPYKNLDRLMEIIDLLKKRGRSIKLLITTVISPERRRHWTNRFSWYVGDVFEFPRLEPRCHALLYKMADLVIHPSLVEGGPTPFPAFEAASVGTPALMQEGRHTAELAARVGEARHAFCVDLFDTETAIARVTKLLDDAAEIERNVNVILRTCDSWQQVSKRFESALQRLQGWQEEALFRRAG